jgi:DNA invertase Pin-like site-specific DNA recombinase
MQIGYARISTDKQTAAAQRRALEAAGCERIVEEQASGAKDRPQLIALLDILEIGDTLTVWKFDRLGRSLPDLLNIVMRIEARAAHLVSLTEQIDTSTSSGRMVFHVMGALAQFERDLISERTKAGLEAAKAEGVTLGRPRKLTPAKIKHARKLIDSGESPPRVAKSLGVGASTLRAALAVDRVCKEQANSS